MVDRFAEVVRDPQEVVSWYYASLSAWKARNRWLPKTWVQWAKAAQAVEKQH